MKTEVVTLYNQILHGTCQPPILRWQWRHFLLYPPSERSETGAYTVFSFVCLSLCVSVRTQSSL